MPWLGFTERGVVLAFELPVSLGVLDWLPQVNAAKWRWHYLGLLFLLVGLRANAKTTREQEREGGGERWRKRQRDSSTGRLLYASVTAGGTRQGRRRVAVLLEMPPALFSAPNNLCRN